MEMSISRNQLLLAKTFLTLVSGLSVMSVPTVFADPETQDTVVKDLVTSADNIEKTDDKLKKMEAEVLSKLNEAPGKEEVLIASELKSTPTPTTPLKDLKNLETHPAIANIEEPVKPVVVVPDMASEKKLIVAENQVKALNRELATTKKSLKFAEKRIGELSTVARSETVKTSSQKTSLTPAVTPVEQEPRVEDIFSRERANFNPSPNQIPELELEPPATSESSHTTPSVTQYSDQATVVLPQTAVRVGPSRLDSVLFYLPVRYKVSIERRTGEWYRIIATNGVRGWVYGGSLTFFPNENQDSTVRIRAYNAKYDSFRTRF